MDEQLIDDFNFTEKKESRVLSQWEDVYEGGTLESDTDDWLICL
jgi:hypothetical protein